MLKVVTAWFKSIRARRARHLALTELLTMDAHRLDDLGISIADVMQAIDDQSRPLRPTETLPPRRVIASQGDASAGLSV